jgi:hypothetical protein
MLAWANFPRANCTADWNHRAVTLNSLVEVRVARTPVCVARAALVRLARATAACRISPYSALRVLAWFKVAHVYFVFLFVRHNTFLGLLFLFSGCVSRAEELPSARHLFVWNQVIQADQLLFRRLLPLSSTLPGFGVLFFLR